MKNSVSALIERLNKETFTDADQISQIVREAQKLSPELGEVVAACAIPRKVDNVIIGVLRAKPNALAENNRIMQELRTFRFVTERTDGGFAYHDSIRQLFFRDWRGGPSDAGHLELFQEFNARLVKHYQSEANRISLATIFDPIKNVSDGDASPSGSRPIDAETRKIDAMLEAIYHDGLRYPPYAFARFKKNYDECSDAQAIRACHALIQGTRDQLERLGGDHQEERQLEKYRNQLLYYDGMLAARELNLDSAEQIYRKLLGALTEPSTLKLQVLEELGSVLTKQDKASEARSFLEAAADISEETGIDASNQAQRLYTLAWCYRSIQQTSTSIATYEQALESARLNRNFKLETYVQSALSSALTSVGRTQEGVEAALASLDMAYTVFPIENDLLFAVKWQWMEWCSASSPPAVLDTLYQEALALLAEGSKANERDDLECHYGTALRMSGQLNRASEKLCLRGKNDPDLSIKKCFEMALLEEAWGESDAALESYNRIFASATGSGDRWLTAAGHVNSGCIHRDALRFQQAASEFATADADWSVLGLEHMKELVEVTTAVMKIHTGEAAEVLSTLLRIKRSWELVGCPYMSLCIGALAKANRTLGNADRSNGFYKKNIDLSIATGELATAAENALELASIESSRGHWQEAEHWSAQARGFLNRLAENENHRPSPNMIIADEKNARAVRLLSRSTEDRVQNLALARAESEEALRLKPDHALYRLTYSYIAALQGDHAAAADALGQVLKREATWSDSPTLRKRLHVWQQNILEPAIESKSSRERLMYEIGPDLRPDNAVSKIEFEENIRTMRTTINTHFGLALPSLRIRVNEKLSEADGYVILLDGKLIAKGRIMVEARASVPSELALTLQNVLLTHLGDCFSYEDFTVLLARWLTEAEDEVPQALADRIAKIRFWNLLRDALARQRSILDWRSMLSSLANWTEESPL